jgi:membrane protein DedA with SNARE-associated domain
MPFSGFLVASGRFNLWLVALAGTLGCLIGSIITYFIGYYGGRPLVLKYGKYVLLHHRDLELAERWFAKYGDVTIFFSRLLPIVRTFISLPAGISKMNFSKFVLYTILGSFPWCLGLTYIGFKLGENWQTIGKYFRGADWIIFALIVALIAWWIWRHIRMRNEKDINKASNLNDQSNHKSQ